MKRIAAYLFFAVLLACSFAGGVAWRTWMAAQKKDTRKPLYYVDPMHPWYKSDKPGIAPDCGMKLEPVYEGAAPKETRKPLYYRDPKQPSYRADAPGINPETGNDLEPVYDEVPANAVQVAGDKHELMGITFATAEYTTETQSIPATGKIAVDETRVVRVHSKTEGWVEQTFVNYTGALVRKGDPLLTLYSPELLATQQELILALKARESMHHSSMPALRLSGDSLVEATRRRLSLWDLTPAQIAEVEKTGKPVRAVTLFSPADGYVLEREAFPNQKIDPAMKLYTLADLSRVWIFADVFESDASSIGGGMQALVTVGTTGRTLRATVTNIQPMIEASTRTLKVRLEAANPGYALRPDMWVEVNFQPPAARCVTVPASAVIDSGTAQIVYVDRGGGNLEPRRVEIGARGPDRIEIRKGLNAGERIVASGAFLLHSESQMRSLVPGNTAQPSTAPTDAHAGHQHD
jgi:RND family efflux transporter MFP subunit